MKWLNFIRSNLELILWTSALPALYYLPLKDEHFSLCLLNQFGMEFCPGCGLGHSIHYYLHMDFSRGWNEHVLGGFALIMIIFRIFQLALLRINMLKLNQT